MSENGNVSLYAKLARISGELGAIAKDGRAPDAMGGFAFISQGSVVAHLREKLAKYDVAVLESLEMVSDESFVMKTSKGERDARRIVVKLTVEFVNGENPDEHHLVTWYGEGIDTADKGLQKAATSAQKYLLMKTFLVSDKDDPDGEAVEGEPVHTAQPRRTQQRPRDRKPDTNGHSDTGEDIHPDIPTNEQLEELRRLASALPDTPKNHIWVDDQAKRYGNAKVLAALLQQHAIQCESQSCEHILRPEPQQVEAQL